MSRIKDYYWCNRCDGIHSHSISCADHQLEQDARYKALPEPDTTTTPINGDTQS